MPKVYTSKDDRSVIIEFKGRIIHNVPVNTGDYLPTMLHQAKIYAQVIDDLVKNNTKFWVVVRQQGLAVVHEIHVRKPVLLPGFASEPFNLLFIIEVNHDEQNQ